jgi:hypothetical protein
VKRRRQPLTGDLCTSSALDTDCVFLLRVSELDRDRVCAFFRGVQVDVRATEGPSLGVSIPGALTPEHELRELTGYVATWNALNPSCHVELAPSNLRPETRRPAQ